MTLKQVFFFIDLHGQFHLKFAPNIFCWNIYRFLFESTTVLQWISKYAMTAYSYWLDSRTTTVLFELRTDLLPEAAGWVQQIRTRVKQNGCCPRSQSVTPLLYTLIFFNKIIFTLFTHISIICFQYPRLSSARFGASACELRPV